MTEPDFVLKTPRVPIGQLHDHKTKYREGKVLRRTDHDFSGSQLLVVRKRVPEKHLSSCNLCDNCAPETSFGAGHCRIFRQLRTVEPRHRKLKAHENLYWTLPFMCLASGLGAVAICHSSENR